MVEVPQNHLHSGCGGVRDAAVHLPLPGEDLRKVHIVVRACFGRNVYLSASGKPGFCSLPQSKNNNRIGMEITR